MRKGLLSLLYILLTISTAPALSQPAAFYSPSCKEGVGGRSSSYKEGAGGRSAGGRSSSLSTIPESYFLNGKVDSLRNANPGTDYTFLPIVRLDGDFGYDYAEGTVSVYMPDSTESQLAMHAKVKWRGGTTNTDGKNKRNYSIKFTDAYGNKQDRKLFGLRKDNHWILDAGQVDLSRIRNRVATDLWNDFATKPYYFSKEPKALTGTRGQFVEVFLNDEYRGIYCMTECIDRSQLKLKKYTDNSDGTQTIHGQLWKTSGFINTLSWSMRDDYDNLSDVWGYTELKYPDIEDVTPTDWSVYYNAMQFINSSHFFIDNKLMSREDIDASITNFVNESADYFDLPVLVDYYVFTILLNAVDNFNGKNMYWACYDTKEDKKLTPAVWDLDCTVGGYFTLREPHPIAIVGPRSQPIADMKLLYGLRRFDINGFRQQVYDRYRELRSTYFSEDALKKRYNDYMDMLRRCNAYARETERWSGDSDLEGNALDFDAEQEYINNWIEERLAFLDDNIDKTLDVAYEEDLPVLELIKSNVWQPVTDEPVITETCVTYENGFNELYDNGETTLQLYNDISDAYLLTLPEKFDITDGKTNPDSLWIVAPKGTIAESNKTVDFTLFLDFERKGTYTVTPLNSITGIKDVTMRHDGSNCTYNILGQRISPNARKNSRRQIIISNGRKFWQ